jgi:hypothetical protein
LANDYTSKLQNFISWGANEENIPATELNLACSVISKVFSVFYLFLSMAKAFLIINLKR